MNHVELPNIVTMCAARFEGTHFAAFLIRWQDSIFALLAGIILIVFSVFSSMVRPLIPRGLQNFSEMLVGAIDDFICSVLGKRGSKYTPFIGTLFLYILTMNCMGLVPFFKSPTANLSITAALAICVFVYVQYTALKELGLFGYIDHLAGKPRGIILFTIVIPPLLFFVHLISEFVRPLTLSLRLRSNIWGDDSLLTLLTTGYALKGVLLLLFTTVLTLISSVVQAAVFSLLTTVYFALAMKQEKE